MNETTDRDYHPVAPENAYNTVVANLGHLYYHFLQNAWGIPNSKAARQGTRRKSNQISFADPRFKPSWWPKDVWKWEETKSFSKVSEAFWSNYNLDNNFTTFMKFCVCQCLESHRILPEDHVNPHYNKEQLKGRMRHRGIITSPACSSSENSERTTSVNTSVQTEDVDNSRGPGEGSNLSDTDSQVAGNNIDNSQGPGEATPSFLDQAEDNPAPL